ncbi:bifunctional helix-turn-helix transcriptional regulator/GNAT family N-acetyltransferase [Aliiglaciecola sp. M165]|uniref:bifunctional helix-turn-helix transcriptional regulator/GNAT family N-acetyltransferase n=1 Tax=Aliiglaciecola sp. M165 TaxID=2593649 RepID=UPI00117C96A8|nr:bifunctional helix-turn-helix transcriptional regulator/GNAT family N-acetyltransferase [Aliiglaciecola sp. M165]TRY33182.1 MarR family transcriptional regulator [Aliiglaciecola sp. M165]
MHEDFLDELGELALGSRLKRVSEKMLADAAKVYEHFGMAIQPKWFTLLALLDKKHTVSVVEASEYLGLSQPALSQFCRQLSAKELINVAADKSDSRKKVIQLSAKGRVQVQVMKPIWSAVNLAAIELSEQSNNQFYQALLLFEASLAEKSLLQRSQHHFKQLANTQLSEEQINIIEFKPTLASYFDVINSQWIEEMFVLEEVDKRVLRYPQKNIIEKGGKIWFAEHPSLGIVGTCALLNKGNGAYELTKMGVLKTARGLKVGEILLQHVIEQAQSLPLNCLFLLTNAKCEAAIHLYEKNGFVHDKEIMDSFGRSYQRCDVAMRWTQEDFATNL